MGKTSYVQMKSKTDESSNDQTLTETSSDHEESTRKKPEYLTASEFDTKVCDYCGLVFYGRFAYVSKSSHMRKIHADVHKLRYKDRRTNTPDFIPDSVFVCHLCGTKCRYRNSLKIHLMKKHNGAELPEKLITEKVTPVVKKPAVMFFCPYCDRKYQSRDSVLRHCREHHKDNEEPKEFQTEIGIQYSQRTILPSTPNSQISEPSPGTDKKSDSVESLLAVKTETRKEKRRNRERLKKLKEYSELMMKSKEPDELVVVIKKEPCEPVFESTSVKKTEHCLTTGGSTTGKGSKDQSRRTISKRKSKPVKRKVAQPDEEGQKKRRTKDISSEKDHFDPITNEEMDKRIENEIALFFQTSNDATKNKKINKRKMKKCRGHSESNVMVSDPVKEELLSDAVNINTNDQEMYIHPIPLLPENLHCKRSKRKSSGSLSGKNDGGQIPSQSETSQNEDEIDQSLQSLSNKTLEGNDKPQRFNYEEKDTSQEASEITNMEDKSPERTEKNDLDESSDFEGEPLKSDIKDALHQRLIIARDQLSYTPVKKSETRQKESEITNKGEESLSNKGDKSLETREIINIDVGSDLEEETLKTDINDESHDEDNDKSVMLAIHEVLHGDTVGRKSIFDHLSDKEELTVNTLDLQKTITNMTKDPNSEEIL
ncbi:myb-like protein X [Mytilus edulis]|uniref:myb-like protein X n=1 Tax=Mytilus edulis TaxID=6550 RepID=UPI0039F0F650